MCKLKFNMKMNLLQMYLHSWRSDELSMLVGAKTTGATPLVIACRNGHYDVAEYLIERCKADIEQPGSGIFFCILFDYVHFILSIAGSKTT